MIATIEKLENYIKSVPGRFLAIDGVSVENKPSPDKWSKKEVLGHLVDSAINNLQRLIRIQYEPGVKIVYDQDNWVKIQNYQELDKESVVELWYLMNQQFIRIIKSFPPEKLKLEIDTGKQDVELHTAEFLIADYLAHMEHHLEQIFGLLD
jgi:predicted peroxiredoxin